MKTFQKILFLSLAVWTFTACGDDDDRIPQRAEEPQGASANSNPTTEGSAMARYEVPAIQQDANSVRLVRRTDKYGITYIIEYDKAKKAQRWTCYQMDAGNSVKGWSRKSWETTEWGGDPFQEDPDLPKEARTTLSQYSGSGYDRGHICPSEDRIASKEMNEQTFYLSNILPQKNCFNASPGVWGNMEIWLRNTLNTREFRDVLYVVKGGTITNGLVKEPIKGLIVPQYYYMAVVCEKNSKYKGLAFWAYHETNKEKAQATTIRSCIISIDELEKKTGIDFFCNLPDDIENTVEATVNPSEWKL